MNSTATIHDRIDAIADRYDGPDYRRELLALAQEVARDRRAYAEVLEQVRQYDEEQG